MARSSRPPWRNSHQNTSSGWSWCQNAGYIGQIDFRISLFDSWDTTCCLFNSVTAFTWFYRLQIVPFALSVASVDIWFARETDGICADHAARLRYCWTKWLTSSRDWWWAMIFLNTLSRRIWTLSRDDMVTKPRLNIQSKNSCLRSCGTRAASMLSTNSQIISKRTATIL
jgi:hypothetical protein